MAAIYGERYAFGALERRLMIKNYPESMVKSKIRERHNDWTTCYIKHRDGSITEHLVVMKNDGDEITQPIARNSEDEIQLRE